MMSSAGDRAPEVYEGLALYRQHSILILYHARHAIETIGSMLQDLKNQTTRNLAARRLLWIAILGGESRMDGNTVILPRPSDLDGPRKTNYSIGIR